MTIALTEKEIDMEKKIENGQIIYIAERRKIETFNVDLETYLTH